MDIGGHRAWCCLPRYVPVGSLFVGATESPQIADSSYFQIIGDYCMLSCLESTAGRCVVRKVGMGGGGGVEGTGVFS